MALEDARDTKRAELREQAEGAYWSAFAAGCIPSMEKDYVLGILPASGVALDAVQTLQVAQARVVVEKLRAKLALVDAATTEAELEGVSWTP